MDEDDAVEAFERLGLTSYEAKVFIALHRIGSGTAREVSDVTDVPRSQVYSAAESLADRGLVDIQQSSPIQYRPVDLEAARSILEDRFERERDRAFDFVESVRAERDDEQREDIWTIRGRDGISDRVEQLIGEAQRRVVFGAPETDQVTDATVEAVADRVAAGVDATVVSESDAVLELFEGVEGARLVSPPPMLAGNERSGRLVLADDDVLLLSVLDAEGDPEGETAVWSAHTNFAAVLIQLVEISLGVG